MLEITEDLRAEAQDDEQGRDEGSVASGCRPKTNVPGPAEQPGRHQHERAEEEEEVVASALVTFKDTENRNEKVTGQNGKADPPSLVACCRAARELKDQGEDAEDDEPEHKRALVKEAKNELEIGGIIRREDVPAKLEICGDVAIEKIMKSPGEEDWNHDNGWDNEAAGEQGQPDFQPTGKRKFWGFTGQDEGNDEEIGGYGCGL